MRVEICQTISRTLVANQALVELRLAKALSGNVEDSMHRQSPMLSSQQDSQDS